MGAIVSVIHDSSNALRAFTRMIGESYLSVKYFWVSLGFNVIYLAVFVYTRLMVFPFCVIYNLFKALPTKGSEWELIYL